MRQSTPGYAAVQAPLSPADRGEIDLVALAREIGRKKWIVGAVTLGTLILSTIAVNVVKPRYTGETRVFLESRDTEYTRFGRDPVQGSGTVFDQDAVLSHVQLIQSRDIARSMIQRFNLGQRPEFDDLLGGIDPLTRIAVLLGFIPNPASMSPEERILDKYFDKLKAFAVARSRVVAIEFQSKDPELAAKLADAIAEEYIAHLEAAKKGSARAAGSWLGRTIDALRQRVATAEARVEAYRTENGLFLVGGGADSGNISAQQLSELNTQLAAARSQQAEFAAKARNIREAIRQGRIFEVSDVVNNEVVRRLIEQRATLKAQIAQEERTLLPQHPRVKELRAQLGGLEEQVRAAAERTARAMENDARAAGARVAASQAELDQQKRASGTANEQEVQLRALEREAKAEREQLETYLARYRDASVRDADNAVAADARIVSRAIVPTNPSFPKRLPIIIVATLAGLTISLFWVLTRALLNESVYVRRRDSLHEPAPVMAHWSPPQQAYPAMMSQGMVHAPVDGATASDVPDAVAETTDDAAPDAAIPAHAQPQAEPALSDATLTMLKSLHRVADSLAGRNAAESNSPALREAPSDTFPGPQVAAVASSQVSPATAPDGGDFDRSRIGPTFLKPAVDGRPIDPSHPLFEVVEEIEATMIRGRPVSVLVLSIESADHAAPTAALLERMLLQRGLSAGTVAETPETALEFAALVRGADRHMDCLVLNVGAVSQATSAMARTATLTILVASDDLGDTRTDEAGRLLAGCGYFIVDAEPDALESA